MLVGILKPPKHSPRPMLKVYEKILEFNHIPFKYLSPDTSDFWDEVKKVDLFVAKIAQTDDELELMSALMPIICMHLGVKTFPNLNTVWHYDDKVKQYYLLKQYGISLAESYIFWDKDNALQWAKNATYPKVFKLKGGAGSVNVKKINKKEQAIALINKSFGSGIHPHFFDFPGKVRALNRSYLKLSKYYLRPFLNMIIGEQPYKNYRRHKNYVYFQEFLPDNLYDTRVCILGGRGFAFKRFVRPNDFRASGSNHYDLNRDHIDLEMVKTSFEISKRLGFQSMAYDYAYDAQKQPKLIEISYTYGDYPEFSTGYWDDSLNWHEGHYYPEYLELVDALEHPGLKQPDLVLDSPYKKAKVVE